MADLNPIAKRIYNVTPEPVRLTLDDGTEGVFRLSSAEFFQEEFQGEGSREDDDADYRFVTSEDNESLLVGRRGAGDDGWTMVGEVLEAARA